MPERRRLGLLQVGLVGHQRVDVPSRPGAVVSRANVDDLADEVEQLARGRRSAGRSAPPPAAAGRRAASPRRRRGARRRSARGSCTARRTPGRTGSPRRRSRLHLEQQRAAGRGRPARGMMPRRSRSSTWAMSARLRPSCRNGASAFSSAKPLSTSSGAGRPWGGPLRRVLCVMPRAPRVSAASAATSAAGVPEDDRRRRRRRPAAAAATSSPWRRSSHRAAAPRGAARASALTRSVGGRRRRTRRPAVADVDVVGRSRSGEAEQAAHAARQASTSVGDVRRPAGSPMRRPPATAGRSPTWPATSPACVPPDPVATTTVRAATPAPVALVGELPRGVAHSRARPPVSPRPAARRTAAVPRLGARRALRRTASSSSSRVGAASKHSRAPAARASSTFTDGTGRARRRGTAARSPGRTAPAATAAAAQKFELALPPATRTSQPSATARRRAGTPGRAPCCRRRAKPVRSSRLTYRSVRRRGPAPAGGARTSGVGSAASSTRGGCHVQTSGSALAGARGHGATTSSTIAPASPTAQPPSTR